LRQEAEQPDQLGDESVVVIDIEGPDPKIANLATQ